MKLLLTLLFHQAVNPTNNLKDTVDLREDIQVKVIPDNNQVTLDSKCQARDIQVNSQEVTQVCQVKDIQVSSLVSVDIQANSLMVSQANSPMAIQDKVLLTVNLNMVSLSLVTCLSSQATNLNSQVTVILNSHTVDIKATTQACTEVTDRCTHLNMVVSQDINSHMDILLLRNMHTAMLAIKCSGLVKTLTQEQLLFNAIFATPASWCTKVSITAILVVQTSVPDAEDNA